MNYVDGFLLSIPTKKIPAYRKLARKAGKIWREHGALDFNECIGDDFSAKGPIPFSKMLKTRSNETVVFSWIVYKSRAHRDHVNAHVMKDPRMDMDMKDMPFDPKRMLYGGFKVLVHA